VAFSFAVADVSARLRTRIERDFPEPGSAQEIVRILGEASDSERVQAAIVLSARGEIARLRSSVILTGQDWRDTLVGGGLGGPDWRQRLDIELGPVQ